ncbi:type III secretion system (T3SS) inner membrane Yop/YscD-like protein [Mumia flava]|uniref:Type III secretion system (T3SS) inner membrane Yop/YscD-like protein n=1 Tax=Mumia flava TaxID=1348852 RepID=A0A0B2B8D0_9ACTN|nr:FHA domain-containing protein [Mumia flava]PJJ53408.1 type III secretion system (T3SS) inner membrane Yop/YscD-like protein [Mumia flava]
MSPTNEDDRPDVPESATETTSTISLPPTAEGDAGSGGGLTAEDASALDALPPGSALLVVQRGPSAGARFLLDADEVSAGRHPDSDIFLDDVTVSRRHAIFRRGPQGYSVSDVGSLNGTYVNRDRIDDVALSSRDEVQIGKYRLVYYPSAARGASS